MSVEGKLNPSPPAQPSPGTAGVPPALPLAGTAGIILLAFPRLSSPR